MGLAGLQGSCSVRLTQITAAALPTTNLGWRSATNASKQTKMRLVVGLSSGSSLRDTASGAPVTTAGRAPVVTSSSRRCKRSTGRD